MDGTKVDKFDSLFLHVNPNQTAHWNLLPITEFKALKMLDKQRAMRVLSTTALVLIRVNFTSLSRL